MKVLRVLGNIIIGIIIFSLIFATILTSKATEYLTGDVLQETIKTAIDDVSNNDNNLTESQKKAIDDMFGDSEASGIINMVLDNYKEYKENENYSVSEEDAERLYNFVYKYKDRIQKLSNREVKEMDEKEFKEFFNQEEIDKFAKDSFKEFDKNFDEKTIDVVLKSYSIATSLSMKVLLIFIIVIFIGILCLINWSLIKWMLVVGIDFIVSGMLFTAMFIALSLLKENVLNNVLKKNIDLEFTTFLKSGIIQIFVGIVLIVLYVILKKNFNKSKVELKDDKEI